MDSYPLVRCCRHDYNSAPHRRPARRSWRVSLSNTSKHSRSECTRTLGSLRWRRSTTLGPVNRSVEPIAQGGRSYSLSLWIAAASKALMTPFGSCQVGQAHGSGRMWSKRDLRPGPASARPSPPRLTPRVALGARLVQNIARPWWLTLALLDARCGRGMSWLGKHKDWKRN